MKDDDKLAGTEIYEYSEDGWYITDHFYCYPANHLQNNTAICFDNTDGLIYFVKNTRA